MENSFDNKNQFLENNSFAYHDNSEIMSNFDTDEISEILCESLVQRYQEV